ncbi:hypothetical protein [Epilithonimonas hispanica]|uniref:Uncharacterized protein n=1 Tax=Epilithonimonas hispanica TaxID=358687 RepID=A0A3D9CJU2_9FLAO|nr:hypothetical protein [Epilithonimonas hispanica]REC66004.1 hypothetical protein DRF58_17390 [Epilithonimonas hispanica]
MKKTFIALSTFLINTLSFGQVGINTQTPMATLDIVASPSDLTKIDGIIAPRIMDMQIKIPV